MEVRNCARCKKMFVYVGRKVCPDCRELDQQDFDRVRQFLQKTPSANLDVVHEGTGVDREKILEFIREGRLEVKKDGFGAINKCEICGTTLEHGRICDICLRQFKQSYSGIESKGSVGGLDRGRMYISDRLDKRKGK